MAEQDPTQPQTEKVTVSTEKTTVTEETTFEEPTVVTASAEAEQPVIVVDRPRKVYAGMWGIPEIAAVAVSALVLILVIVVYFFWVLPSGRELARNRSEADRLEAEMVSARAKYGEINTTQGQVDVLVASVDDFESRFLPMISNGQTALYQRLNGLINAYGLVNTSGPDYAPLETADKESREQNDGEKGRSKFRSLYPGVYVSTTLEGSYQNLRRFIRDIETGSDFVIVSAVELAPSDSEKKKEEPQQMKAPAAGPVAQMPPTAMPNASRGFPPGFQSPQMQPQPQQSAPASRRPQGKTHGDVVSLHIEMAAYFRRPNFAPAVQ
jgi:hypothetical protein